MEFQKIDSQKNQILEEINIDVNNILNFSINIDNLKIFVTTLIKNQSILSQKYIELEKRFNEKFSDNLDGENHKIKEKEELFPKKEIKSDNIKENEENKNNNLLENKNKTDKGFEKNNEIELSYTINDTSKNISLSNKINILEQKIKNLEILNKFKPYSGNIEDKDDQIQLIEIEMNKLKETNDKLLNENFDIKKKIEDINVKLVDINIYELFKNLNVDDGSVDEAKLLVMNLENKVFKKFSLMDDRDKKVNHDILELNNKIQNFINKNEVISYKTSNINTKLQELEQFMNNINNDTTKTITNLEKKNDNLYKELIEKITEEKNSLDSNIKRLNDKLYNLEQIKQETLNPNIIKKSSNFEFTEETLEFIKKMANKINKIEEKVNSIIELSRAYTTQEDLIKIIKELKKKMDMKEYFELNDKCNINSAKITSIDENIGKLNDLYEKNESEIIFYSKRIESLMTNIISLRNQIDDILKREKEQKLDLTQFLEKNIFYNYIATSKSEKIKIEKNFEEMLKSINNISKNLTKKCDSDDLKTFEDLINKKIEEMKFLNIKRFADKIDTNKNLKYIEAQIKHIIDLYIKKKDIKEKWLLAKKPIGGYSCASCESFIGDLKNKESFVPWNQYPQREPEKNFRVGNGFSRMLNMLDIENMENKFNDFSCQKGNESDEGDKKNLEEKRIKHRIKYTSSNKKISPNNNRNNNSALLKSNTPKMVLSSISSLKNSNIKILPKLHFSKNEELSNYIINEKEHLDISEDEIKKESNLNKEKILIDGEHPHITKIIKKIKTNFNLTDSSKT